MTVSVIIPTYNGAHKLPTILEALQKQNYKDFDLIIAIDGSTDNTLQILQSFKTRFNSFKVIGQENKGRASVRNKGANEAQDGLLIFFDDDMRPGPECVQTHVQHHERVKDSILTGEQVEEVRADTPEFLRFKAYLSNIWKRNGGDLPLGKEQIFITAANFSISKKTFEELGGFDERLKDAEDFDLAVRAFKSGIPLYLNYNAFAWHDDQVSCALYIKRQRQYTQAHKTLIRLKPWMDGEGFIKPVKQPVGIKKIVYRFFLSAAWIKAVDSGRLKILPKILRYKIYDLIITANGVYFPDKVVFSEN